MILTEFEGKELFKRYGIAIPNGTLYTKESSIPDGNQVLKAQVHFGDRLRLGGILFSNSAEDSTQKLASLLGSTVQGEIVKEVLVEEKVLSLKEYYVSFSYDTYSRGPVLAFSTSGGTATDTALITPLSAITGLTDKDLGTVFAQEKIPEEEYPGLRKVLHALWKVFDTQYALVAEINPLFKTAEGFVAGDAKIQLDDENIQPGEKRVLELPGDIAILASGGGASLLNMDALMRAGGKPANYTEYSGNPPASVVKDLTLRVLARTDLQGLWVVGAAANFTDIYETMSGFLEALDEVRPTYPIVIRRDGPRREEAFEMLRKASREKGYDLHLYDATTSMIDTARIMVDLAYKPI